MMHITFFFTISKDVSPCEVSLNGTKNISGSLQGSAFNCDSYFFAGFLSTKGVLLGHGMVIYDLSIHYGYWHLSFPLLSIFFMLSSNRKVLG